MTNWQTKKLGDVLEKIEGGGTPSKDKKEFWNGSIPWASVKDLTSFNPKETQDYITDEGLKNSSSRLVKAGTLITPTRMALGFTVRFDVDVAINQDLKALYPIDDVSTEFIQYWFEAYRKTIEKLGTGSTVAGIQVGELRALKIQVPEKPEQERIVGVLEVWDEYIEKLEQKIALKEQLKKGLMQQLLTGKRRLPGFEGDWQKLKLSDIAKIRKGTQLNRSTLSENMAGLNKYAVINGGITPSGYTDTMNTKAGAITISEGGNSCGYVNYIKEDFWLGGHCYEIINNQKVDQIYLYPFLKANQSKIMSLRVGSGLPNIQKSSLENLKVLLPETKKEQEELGLIMLHSVIEIEQLSEKLQIMKLQKKYLLKKLITGTIRTPEDLQPLDTSRLERSAL